MAELEQQINALVQERDAFQATAIPTKKRGPVTPRPPQSSKEAHEVLLTRAAKRHAGRPLEDVMPEDAQGLTEWLIDRQCDSRDAMEFVNLPSVGHLSRLIAEGARKLQELDGPTTSRRWCQTCCRERRESVDSCFSDRRHVWVERSELEKPTTQDRAASKFVGGRVPGPTH